MLSDPAIFLWGKMKKRYTKYLIMTSTVFIVLLSQNCKDTITSNDVDNMVIPDSGVSYRQHIAPVFNAKCVNCHGVGITEAGLDLTTWSGTVANPSIVFPGEPENSSLVWSIEGRPGFPAMPPVGSPYNPLNQNQINGVRTWIAEGALNN
jgi:mono/diheme cytochrome c family protein